MDSYRVKDALASVDLGRTLWWISVASLAWALVGGVRRIWLSPLSKFPGPKLAWLTLWNEFYWDVVRRGTFIWRIQEMHERYGNILIRIAAGLAWMRHGPWWLRD